MASMLLLLGPFMSSFIKYPSDNNAANPRNIQRIGDQLIRNGDYEKCYRLFSGLQRQQHQHYRRNKELYIHYQISCLLRLGKRRQALDVCFAASQHSPSATWYLLAADIYSEEQQLELALWYLRKSYACLSSTNPLWNQVQLQEQILYQGILQNGNGCDTGSTTDMVLALPFDNVCSILMLLPLKTLVRCARVNRTWNHLISSTPLLWQHLTFRGNSHPLSATTLALYLSRLHLAPLLSVTIPNAQDSTGLLIALCNSNCSQLYELDLTYIQCTSQQCWNLICQLMRLAGKTLRVLRLCCGSFRLNSIVDLLSTTCLRLEILDLHNCFPLKDDRPYHNVTTLEHLEQFGGRLPSHLLDHAAGLHILPIQRLVLSDLYGLTSLQLAILLLRCPRLMDLSLLHCSVNIIPAINLLRYSNVEGFHYYRNNQSMVTNLAPAATSETVSTTTTREQGYEVHLHQEYQREGGSLHTPRINSALEKGSSIGDTVTWKRLILQQTQGLTDDILSSLLVNSCHTIVKLDLKGNRQLTDDCFLAMYQRRTDGGMLPLVELGLSNCTGMTEIGLCILFQHTPQLQQLDLSGLINVTDQVLETIALHCPRLLKLDLTHCRTFTDSGIRTFIDSSLRLSPLQHLGLIGTTLSIDALAYAMCHVH